MCKPTSLIIPVGGGVAGEKRGDEGAGGGGRGRNMGGGTPVKEYIQPVA